jgi:hypothetical protein
MHISVSMDFGGVDVDYEQMLCRLMFYCHYCLVVVAALSSIFTSISSLSSSSYFSLT